MHVILRLLTRAIKLKDHTLSTSGGLSHTFDTGDDLVQGPVVSTLAEQYQ
jgi:hypothetical protein